MRHLGKLKAEMTCCICNNGYLVEESEIRVFIKRNDDYESVSEYDFNHMEDEEQSKVRYSFRCPHCQRNVWNYFNEPKLIKAGRNE